MSGAGQRGASPRVPAAPGAHLPIPRLPRLRPPVPPPRRSYVFRDGAVDMERLEALKAAAGGAGRVVLDLSCRRRPSMPPADEEEESDYFVVTDRWQTFTSEAATPAGVGGGAWAQGVVR